MKSHVSPEHNPHFAMLPRGQSTMPIVQHARISLLTHTTEQAVNQTFVATHALCGIQNDHFFMWSLYQRIEHREYSCLIGCLTVHSVGNSGQPINLVIHASIHCFC